MKVLLSHLYRRYSYVAAIMIKRHHHCLRKHWETQAFSAKYSVSFEAIVCEGHSIKRFVIYIYSVKCVLAVMNPVRIEYTKDFTVIGKVCGYFFNSPRFLLRMDQWGSLFKF